MQNNPAQKAAHAVQKQAPSLIEQIENIFRLLADDRLEILGLFRVQDGRLETPLAHDMLSMLTYRSKRPDSTVDNAALAKLVAAIKADGNFKRLNHVGFHYKVAAKREELKRIVSLASSKGFHVYQEPSIDDADWLFVGDISEIDNPLLELLPLQGLPNDKWLDYYLPHIQFDIDTALSPDEIKTLVQKYFHQPGTPYPIQIDGVTYIQRVNLGCMEGVNLMLDISTNHRDINYRRTWSVLV